MTRIEFENLKVGQILRRTDEYGMTILQVDDTIKPDVRKVYMIVLYSTDPETFPVGYNWSCNEQWSSLYEVVE